MTGSLVCSPDRVQQPQSSHAPRWRRLYTTRNPSAAAQLLAVRFAQSNSHLCPPTEVLKGTVRIFFGIVDANFLQIYFTES